MKASYLLYAGILVVGVIIIIVLAKGCTPPKDDNEKKLEVLQQKFDSLAVQINSYKDSLKKYDTAIGNLKLHDSELAGKLEYNKGLQQQLKQQYAKANNRFDNYQSNDITRYFADSLEN